MYVFLLYILAEGFLRLVQFISLCLLIIITGCSTPEESLVSRDIVSSSPIEYLLKENFIDISNTDLFPEVGSVRDKDGNLIGSGVLIAPSVVLTAGHVIDNDSSFMFRIGEWDVMIKEKILHPRYSNTWTLNNDIGIIVLECGVDEIEPAKLHSDGWLYRRSPLTTVGFSGDCKRKSSAGTFFYYGTLQENPTQIKFLPLKDTVWYGDSGGAVYGRVNGKLVLVGIISNFSMSEGRIIDNSATKVLFFYKWIMEVLDGLNREAIAASIVVVE